ncbi:hypothetical protein MUY27_03830 [Mucilaginibacter sp. RS28]|uniref:LTXXQ motif family protein n=1 Tax=Mucilaginibacter straminoryzae TaxID=2932774 RepID=A0A9X1X0J9_9SPHI|nr:hypothetical protein [Mucilaginibacter straminoryzae]MCJ8208823.1 hypothetical protein [Mucilaginibacter straminoryzae]
MKNKIISFRIASVTAILALFSAITGAKAQTPDLKTSTPEQRAEWQNKLMKEKLKLTDTQYHQVSNLNLEYARKMQPVITGEGSRFSRGKKARALMKEKEDKLKQLLTKEQFEAYQQDIKEKMSAAKEAFMQSKNP